MTDGPYVIIRPSDFTMPADCAGCGETYELNDLWSCSDGGVRCRECHRVWIEDGYDEEESP